MARFHHPMRYLTERVRAFRDHLRNHPRDHMRDHLRGQLRDGVRSPPDRAQPDTPL